MKAFVISIILVLLVGVTAFHLIMASADMGMQQASGCLNICLATGHNFSINMPTVKVLELFSLIAIAVIGLLVVIPVIARKHFFLLSHRPGEPPDIITLYAHYLI